MDGGWKETARNWLDEWRSAWRSLPDNPFRGYLLLARRRRLARVGPLRRFMLALILGGAWTVVYIGLIVGQVTSPLTEPEVAYWFVLSFFLVLYLVSLMQGVYQAVADALGLLSLRGGRVERYLAIDDMVAVTSLTDKDVTLGAVSVIWPPLAALVPPGAVLFEIILLALASDQFSRFDNQQFVQTVTFAPLTVMTVTVAGALAALIICFAMISLGLELVNPVSAMAAGVIHALAQFGVVFAGIPTIMMSIMGGQPSAEELGVSEHLSLALLVAIGFIATLWMVLALSARHRLNRSFWMIATPFVLPFVVTCFVIFMTMRSFSSGMDPYEETTYMYLLFNYVWCWCTLGLINPQAVLGALGFGGNINEAFSTPMFELYRYPLLLMVQCSVIVLCAYYAEQAVRRRRQALN